MVIAEDRKVFGVIWDRPNISRSTFLRIQRLDTNKARKPVFLRARYPAHVEHLFEILLAKAQGSLTPLACLGDEPHDKVHSTIIERCFHPGYPLCYLDETVEYVEEVLAPLRFAHPHMSDSSTSRSRVYCCQIRRPVDRLSTP